MAERREVSAGRRRVTIDDEHMYCAQCDESFYTPEQSDQVHRRTNAEMERAENLLSPSEIVGIRGALGMSQTEFDDLLGVGAKSCARWETGRVRQNITTDRLIRLLAAERRNAAILAGINGVALRDSCFVGGIAAPAPKTRWAWFDSTRDKGVGGVTVSRMGGNQEVPQPFQSLDALPRGPLPVRHVLVGAGAAHPALAQLFTNAGDADA